MTAGKVVSSSFCTKTPAFKSFHAQLIINGLAHFPRYSSKLIVFYARNKHLRIARKLFDEIPNSEKVAMVGSFARTGYSQEAIFLFHEMQISGSGNRRILLPSVLKACAHLSDHKTGTKLHALALKNGFNDDSFIVSALIRMYSNCRKVDEAREVFDLHGYKDLVCLNAMVTGYVHSGFIEQANGLVKEMEVLGLDPDIETWNSMISGFTQIGNETMVRKIFETMKTKGINPDIVSWTSVISGLVQNLHFKKAYRAFKQMLKAGISPVPPTISALLPATASIAHTRRGKEIHGYSVVTGFERDVYVRSALIDMYAKGGFIAEASWLFCGRTRNNIVACNSMIFGYGNHGYCEEAIRLFNWMVKGGKKVDHMTFSAALTACANGGMVDVGERLFQMMEEKYCIVPRTEHYATMVDLLGRAGKVYEAYEYIQKMPVEPDSFVWGALLGACRKHGLVDLAERAAKELDKMEPKSSGNIVLLSNLYADTSKWKEAIELKKMIKKKKVILFRSRSWMIPMS